MKTLPTIRILAVAGALTLAPLPASAQVAPPAEPACLEDAFAGLEPLLESRGDWKGVARHLEASVTQLATNDPCRVRLLLQAGRTYAAAEDLATAQRVLHQAGEAALARGEILTAAHAFLDASLVARDRGRVEDVVRFYQRGARLLGSPLLTDEERAALLERLS